MDEFLITIKGKPYLRCVDMLGNVEKVTWFRHNPVSSIKYNSEIFDIEELNTLEDEFEKLVMKTITPIKPII